MEGKDSEERGRSKTVYALFYHETNGTGLGTQQRSVDRGRPWLADKSFIENPGTGTRFEILFSRTKSSMKRPKHAFLIVDDEPSIRRILQSPLKRLATQP